MPKYESKSGFYRTEAKTMVIENDNDATALVAWLMEKAHRTREEVLAVRGELDALIYSEELELSNEAQQALQAISGKLYNIMFGKK
ncbi:hypothetical protein [Serratia sp. Se-RSBMAAmG]|uniref:hypothetical protein n=1 Tax=Serratia sp. Se-RSBMAAmG TaxID=3043305 RepID=UPI0024AFC807|nr:hypothetical protein [Serratia sp. Se-RSBMAAmG]MDI6976085.1 hypothetical protein [Serratia sp. Se-RSBMAAmG]